jgi:hypothetical protein
LVRGDQVGERPANGGFAVTALRRAISAFFTGASKSVTMDGLSCGTRMFVGTFVILLQPEFHPVEHDQIACSRSGSRLPVN